MFGNPVGSSGSASNMADAAISMSELNMGKRKPTFLENLVMNTPQYKAYNRSQLNYHGIKTGDDKLDQVSLSVAQLQNSLKTLPEGSKKDEVNKSLTEAAYTQYANSKILAGDVPKNETPVSSTIAKSIVPSSRPTVANTNEEIDYNELDPNVQPVSTPTYSDASPATGGFTGYSGDYGGPDNDPSGFGGTGGYGMFNKGGLAGKKPKNKMKTYKKGGLVTPKK